MRMHSEVRSMHVFHHVRKVFFGNNNPSVNASKFITEAADPLQGEVEVSEFSFSFAAWCMSATRWVLRSRTAFGRFLYP